VDGSRSNYCNLKEIIVIKPEAFWNSYSQYTPKIFMQLVIHYVLTAQFRSTSMQQLSRKTSPFQGRDKDTSWLEIEILLLVLTENSQINSKVCWNSNKLQPHQHSWSLNIAMSKFSSPQVKGLFTSRYYTMN